jgi:hypothetical protein
MQQPQCKMTHKCHPEAKPKDLAGVEERLFASLRTPKNRRFDLLSLIFDLSMWWEHG